MSRKQEGTQLKSWLYKSSGLLVSVFFVYLAVRGVDLSESVRALGDVQPGWLAVAVLVYLSNFPFRTLRWRGILRNQKALSFKETMVPVLVGHMANNVLPARAGEVYRAHFLGRRAQMSRSGAMGSIVVERTFDGLMLVVMILLVLLLLPQIHFFGGPVLVVGLIFLALAAGILFYGLAADSTGRAIDRGLKLLPPALREFVGRRLGFFLRGIRGISTVGGCLEVGAYTVLIWGLEATAFALVVVSFGEMLPLNGFLLLYVTTTLGTTLPSGPGYVGPFQYAFVLALGFFAISEETALAMSVVAQVALLGSITVIGLALLWREHLRKGGLQDREEETEGETESKGRAKGEKVG